MQINDTLIAYLEELSRLRLSDEEKEVAKTELSRILGYMDILSELDTEGVEAATHPHAFTNVFREDVVAPSMGRDRLLANAPRKKDGCFQVPRTVEG